MTSSLIARAVTLGALMLVSGQAGATNLLTNGSFEQPNITSLQYLNLGSTFMTGWTVAAQPGSAPGTQVQLTDNADFSSMGLVASDGSQYLDLTGNVGRGGGVVSDGFATLAGAQYDVAFDVGAFFVGGVGSFGNTAVDLFIDGVFVQSFTNILGLSSAGSDWERKSYSFTGTGNAMTVGLFASLSTASSSLGVGLDNVVVEQRGSAPGAVPEPASWALMIAGLGVAGAVLRRRGLAASFA